MGPRKLLKEGTVLKAKSKRRLRGFLCSDIFVLTDEGVNSLYRMVRPLRCFGGTLMLNLPQPIPLAEVEVKPIGRGEPCVPTRAAPYLLAKTIWVSNSRWRIPGVGIPYPFEQPLPVTARSGWTTSI